jgi:hypothetical protein
MRFKEAGSAFAAPCLLGITPSPGKTPAGDDGDATPGEGRGGPDVAARFMGRAEEGQSGGSHGSNCSPRPSTSPAVRFVP